MHSILLRNYNSVCGKALEASTLADCWTAQYDFVLSLGNSAPACCVELTTQELSKGRLRHGVNCRSFRAYAKPQIVQHPFRWRPITLQTGAFYEIAKQQ
jgi:hypothetical protein